MHRMNAETDGADVDDEPTCTCLFFDGPFGQCSSYDPACPRCHGTGVPTTAPGTPTD